MTQREWLAVRWFPFSPAIAWTTRSRKPKFGVKVWVALRRPECGNRTAVEFIKAHIDDASKLAKQLKVDVAFVLAVSEDESGFGGSNIAKNAKNYFGIWAGGANATGVYVTTKGVKVSSYIGVADPYLASGQDFVNAEIGNSKAVGATSATQFFGAIHDKFGVGTADYVEKMVSIATMTALRISCN